MAALQAQRGQWIRHLSSRMASVPVSRLPMPRVQPPAPAAAAAGPRDGGRRAAARYHHGPRARRDKADGTHSTNDHHHGSQGQNEDDDDDGGWSHRRRLPSWPNEDIGDGRGAGDDDDGDDDDDDVEDDGDGEGSADDGQAAGQPPRLASSHTGARPSGTGSETVSFFHALSDDADMQQELLRIEEIRERHPRGPWDRIDVVQAARRRRAYRLMSPDQKNFFMYGVLSILEGGEFARSKRLLKRRRTHQYTNYCFDSYTPISRELFMELWGIGRKHLARLRRELKLLVPPLAPPAALAEAGPHTPLDLPPHVLARAVGDFGDPLRLIDPHHGEPPEDINGRQGHHAASELAVPLNSGPLWDGRSS